MNEIYEVEDWIVEDHGTQFSKDLPIGSSFEAFKEVASWVISVGKQRASDGEIVHEDTYLDDGDFDDVAYSPLQLPDDETLMALYKDSLKHYVFVHDNGDEPEGDLKWCIDTLKSLGAADE